MKTAFIQTHELAHQLTPHDYTCYRLGNILSKATGRFRLHQGNQGFDLHDSASLVILSLLREQKEDLMPPSLYHEARPYYYRGGRVIINGFHLDEVCEFAKDKEIRQRLINSLLTRPDRTLCVLIPE